MVKILIGLFWISGFLLFYNFLGYPAVLTLLVAFKKKEKTKLPETFLPSVSLIIAAYNEQGVIREKIENTLALDYPRDRFEIIVAADGSSDNTVAIVKEFEEEIILSFTPERGGKVAALMNAKKITTKDIIVISDANNMYNPDTLFEVLQPLANPDVGGVSGAKHITQSENQISQNEGFYWRYEDYIKQKENELGACMASCGEVLAIRKEYFNIPDISAGIADDSFLLLQVYQYGKTFLYAPKAKSYELSSEKYMYEIERRSRISAQRYNSFRFNLLPKNSFLHTWEYFSHKVIRLFSPVFMLILFFSNLLLLGFNLQPISRIIYWVGALLQIVFYSLAIFENRSNQNSFLGKIVSLSRFLIVSNYALFLGLIMFLTGSSSKIWKKIER